MALDYRGEYIALDHKGEYIAVDHKTPLKSSTNLVFISRFNPIIDSSKVGCCSDEVHVVVGVVILRSGGWGEGGWLLHARMLCT